MKEIHDEIFTNLAVLGIQVDMNEQMTETIDNNMNCRIILQSS